jgi:hypothetical protein
MTALGALYPKERPSSPVAFSAWLRGSRRGGFQCGAYSERASDGCLLACSNREFPHSKANLGYFT